MGSAACAQRYENHKQRRDESGKSTASVTALQQLSSFSTKDYGVKRVETKPSNEGVVRTTLRWPWCVKIYRRSSSQHTVQKAKASNHGSPRPEVKPRTISDTLKEKGTWQKKASLQVDCQKNCAQQPITLQLSASSALQQPVRQITPWRTERGSPHSTSKQCVKGWSTPMATKQLPQ